eukprot:TRINITY_DN759_c0_g1_i2.p1 TRINITY_DN759_c0_g1~~TRINITY_DN759_c0_g1_i2.p1  ORF type:complete len:394 (+),score=66.02 TRINITY_DN759_c0_g1_i2:204-1385(+)
MQMLCDYECQIKEWMYRSIHRVPILDLPEEFIPDFLLNEQPTVPLSVGEENAKMIEMGCGYLERGELDDAEACFIKALEGGDVSAGRYLGKISIRKGKIRKAEEYYKKSVDLGDFHAMYELGSFYVKKNELNRALLYFYLIDMMGESIPGFKEEYLRARIVFGMFCFWFQDHEHVPHYLAGTEEFEDITPLLLLIWSFDRRRNWEEAERYISILFLKKGLDKIDHVLVGIDDPGKQRYLKMAFKRGHIGSAILLGDEHVLKGLYEDAKCYFTTALKNGSHLALVKLGTLSLEQEQFPEAKMYFQKYLSKCGYSETVRYHLKVACFKLREHFPWSENTHLSFPEEFRLKAKLLLLIYERNTILRGLGKDVLFIIIRKLGEMFSSEIYRKYPTLI